MEETICSDWICPRPAATACQKCGLPYCTGCMQWHTCGDKTWIKGGGKPCGYCGSRTSVDELEANQGLCVQCVASQTPATP